MARIRINYAGITFEVEGEEEFVKKEYKEFKEEIDGFKDKLEKQPDTQGIKDTKKEKITKKTQIPSKKKKQNDKPTLDKSLDLSKSKRESGLKEYYDKMQPRSFVEKNLIFVAYLEDIAQLKGIGINQIYTCYAHVNSKFPIAFKQSIADTSSKRYGLLDTTSFDDIKLSIIGRNKLKKFPRSSK